MKNKQSRLGALMFAVVLTASTALAYQQVWRASYIWDDDLYITANPLLTASDGWWRIWFSLDSPSQYFPLVYSVFRLEHALWGFNPAGYHWVNIALHAANALLLWRLLRRLLIPGAWLTGGLFALHPVQVESVAWITELKNVLMGFFFFLTLLCWVRCIDADTWRRSLYYVTALTFYALALFSKTTACTLPAALLLIAWLKHKRITWQLCAQVVPFVLFAAIMGVVTIWWERHHQGTEGSAFAVSFAERVLIASRATWFYLGKLIWPYELCFSYPRWTISGANPVDYIWLALTVAAVIAIWMTRHYTGRSVAAAMAFFVATLVPVLGFVMLWTFRYSWVADHYQYLACIGPLALFAAGIDGLGARFGRTGDWSVRVAAAVLLLSLGARTWKQGAIYADAETLWRATIACNPRSALAHNSLGVLLGGRNAPADEEAAEYRQALDGDPNDPQAHNNLGYLLQRLGRPEEALIEYEKSVAADPRYITAHGNLAAVLLQLGRTDEAIAHLQKILALEPRNAALEHSLGDILAGRHKPEEALEHWKRSLELEPSSAELQATVGRALAGTGQYPAALPYLRRAAKLAPGDAQTHFDYASAFALLGHFAEAVPEYGEALRIDPNLAEAHKSLAAILRQLGRKAEAEEHAQRAAQLEHH